MVETTWISYGRSPPAHQPGRGAQYLHRADEIELLDRRHDQHHDAAGLGHGGNMRVGPEPDSTGWPKTPEIRPLSRAGDPIYWRRSAATDRHVAERKVMRQGWFGAISIAVPTLLAAQTGRGPYARIAVLRPNDGQTVEFEAGYLRHLEWHQQARRSLDLVRLDHLGRRSLPLVRLRHVRTFGRQPGQRRDAGRGRAGQRAQRRAARRVGDERPVRVSARALAGHGGAAADATARVHGRGSGARRRTEGVRATSLRRRSPRSRPRRSGFAWWPAGTRRDMSGCARGPASRSCSPEAGSSRCPARSSI